MGAVARYWASLLFGKAWPAFPWGTLAVKAAGSFLLGLPMGATTAGCFLIDPAWRSFLGIGLLGAFTTFSTLAYETVEALRRGSPLQAAAMALGNWA
ncbi:MAG: CrcB family protein [Thermoanaerobaculum sp.]|nr:CrcB family protein [Thermoanaerobaculum sp.]MDW7968030.1 CrcB family protein [Thermoanaerobaculum sp.]